MALLNVNQGFYCFVQFLGLTDTLSMKPDQGFYWI